MQCSTILCCNVTLQSAWSGCDDIFFIFTILRSVSWLWQIMCTIYQWMTAVCCVNIKTSYFVDVVTVSEAVTYRALFEGSVWFHSHMNETLDLLHLQIKLFHILDFKVVPLILRLGTSCMWIKKEKKWSNIIKVEHLKRRLAYPWGQERRMSDTENSSFVCVKEFQYQTKSLVIGTS